MVFGVDQQIAQVPQQSALRVWAGQTIEPAAAAAQGFCDCLHRAQSPIAPSMCASSAYTEWYLGAGALPSRRSSSIWLGKAAEMSVAFNPVHAGDPTLNIRIRTRNIHVELSASITWWMWLTLKLLLTPCPWW